MEEIIQLILRPAEAADEKIIGAKVKEIAPKCKHFKVLKKSIDARKKPVKIILRLLISEHPFDANENVYHPKNTTNSNSVHIIGAGPAGLFAGLRALELGLKPIIYERGKSVRERRKDLAKITKEGKVDSDSNYCFGEGGAGTYSDGKLYTRSKKRGNVKKVLEWFVHFGADENILTEAHPHIGTNKLPQIIEKMRETLLEMGGEIHFESKLTNLKCEDNRIKEIVINSSENIKISHLILATGHSARDIFEMLYQKQITLEAKSFALGVRIEHPQNTIDKIQYHNDEEMAFLPPASYNWVEQVGGRGVYSFCMCPGGIIAPCSTKDGEVVTNGWSPSKRNNPFANSGIVVEIHPEDLPGKNHPFKCLEFQKSIERKAWEMAGKDQKVPAQRLLDFIDGKTSITLPETSYHRGLKSVDLNQLFPNFISKRLKEGFLKIGKKMKGYLTNDAVLHAPESRTSSPVKIPRDEVILTHPDVRNLFPCGEGAGYAGGIVSAAIDGIKCIEKVAENTTQ